MIRAIALLVVIIIFLQSWYSCKKVAQRRCAEFQSYLLSHTNEIENTIKRITQSQNIGQAYLFAKKNEKIFLIKKESSVTIYSLNNARKQTMLCSQYLKLTKKLDKQNPAYSYSFESYSVYYRLPFPNENCILKINS